MFFILCFRWRKGLFLEFMLLYQEVNQNHKWVLFYIFIYNFNKYENFVFFNLSEIENLIISQLNNVN